MREGLGGQVPARVERQVALGGSELVEEEAVAVGLGHDATEWKFFAAARTIAGPPMSMSAITSGSGTPRRAWATDRKG